MCDADWAWAAGLFEGEGCITTTSAGRYLRLHLVTTDEDVVRRFASIVGCGHFRGPRRPTSMPTHHKARYEWTASSRADAARVLAMFWPWLGERRKARARELLGFDPVERLAG